MAGIVNAEYKEEEDKIAKIHFQTQSLSDTYLYTFVFKHKYVCIFTNHCACEEVTCQK